MTVKNWTHWTTLLLISTLTISGCSLIPNKKIDIVSKPLEIDIIQPTMPRNIDLKEPVWHVVSSAKIPNPCIKNEEGKRPRTKQVFESIENDSKELDSLDDPTSDINPNN